MSTNCQNYTKPCNCGSNSYSWYTMGGLKSDKGFKRTSTLTDEKLWGSQTNYPAFIELTCGGNIVNRFRDKRSKSLTPWLALKTLWVTDCKTVKKQQMAQGKRENRVGKMFVYFFGRKKIWGWIALIFWASLDILAEEGERTKSDFCQLAC